MAPALADLVRSLVAAATTHTTPAPDPRGLPTLWEMTNWRVAAESRLRRGGTRWL